jgi:hypothetical protein
MEDFGREFFVPSLFLFCFLCFDWKKEFFGVRELNLKDMD